MAREENAVLVAGGDGPPRLPAKLDEPASTERRAFDLGIPTGRLWTVALGG